MYNKIELQNSTDLISLRNKDPIVWKTSLKLLYDDVINVNNIESEEENRG